MAFDKAFFDSIRLEAVRGKFYRKTEVDALLKELSARAELQNAEEEIRRLKTEKLEARMKELEAETDGAKQVAQTIVGDAKEEADRILAEAKERAAELLGSTEEQRETIVNDMMRQQEQAVGRVEEVFSVLKEQQAESIETINRIWQDFLCGIGPDEDGAGSGGTAVPADLKEKVGAIAEALTEIGSDMEN
jgi:cell division septum initiation protein DivIVA